METGIGKALIYGILVLNFPLLLQKVHLVLADESDENKIAERKKY